MKLYAFMLLLAPCIRSNVLINTLKEGGEDLVPVKIIDIATKAVQQHFSTQKLTMVLSKGVHLNLVNDFLQKFNGTVILSIEPYDSLPKQIVIIVDGVEDFFKLLTDLKPNLKGKDLIDMTALFMITIVSNPRDIPRVTEAMWRMNASNVAIVAPADDLHVAIYSYQPYSIEGNCGNTSPELIFLSGKSSRIPRNLYSNKMKSLHGCPLSISITKVYHPIGINTIPVEIVKMKMVRLLQRALNFKPIFVVAEYASIESDGVNNSTGSLGDLLHGRADISLSSAALTAELAHLFDTSAPYYYIDLSWVSPPVSVTSAWGRMLAPLSHTFWDALLATIGVVFFFLAVLKFTGVRQSCRKYFKRIETVEGAIFRAWGALLGQPVQINPRKFRDFYFVSLWVWFAFTVRSAYQSSLISALKRESLTGDFGRLEEAITAGYRYGGKRTVVVHFDREPEIMKSFVVVPDEEFDALFERLSAGEKFVTPVSLEYVWARCAGRSLRTCVHVLPEPILTLPMVVYLRHRSSLTHVLNDWITRMRESGLLEVVVGTSSWQDTATTTTAAVLPSEPEPLTLQQIAGCFFCLAFGVLSSFIVFLGEIITLHLKRR